VLVSPAASVLATLLFVTFIGANPGFAAVIIYSLCTLLLGMLGAHYALFYRRLGKVEEAVGAVHRRVDVVEKDVLGIKGEATKGLADLRVENAVAHGEIREHLAHMDERLKLLLQASSRV
jgi:hypothetical protein